MGIFGRAAFEAWVRTEYGHEIIVWRGDDPISCPFRKERSWAVEYCLWKAERAGQSAEEESDG